MKRLPRRTLVSTDAIVLLKADHKEIKKVFREFQAAGDGAVRAVSATCPKNDSTLKQMSLV